MFLSLYLALGLLASNTIALSGLDDDNSDFEDGYYHIQPDPTPTPIVLLHGITSDTS